MPRGLTHCTAASPGCRTVSRLLRRAASALRPLGKSSRAGVPVSLSPAPIAAAMRSPRWSTSCGGARRTPPSAPR
eukprot:11011866-Alexandrium_andersonii.AAC.1